jgi:hypothetical protein
MLFSQVVIWTDKLDNPHHGRRLVVRTQCQIQLARSLEQVRQSRENLPTLDTLES